MDEKILVWKSKSDWIKQVKEALAEAEKYGATVVNDFRVEEKDKLRQGLEALGEEANF